MTRSVKSPVDQGGSPPQEEVAAQERVLQAGTQWVGQAPGLPSHAQRLQPSGQHLRGGEKREKKTPNHKTFLLPRAKAIHPKQSPKCEMRHRGGGSH